MLLPAELLAVWFLAITTTAFQQSDVPANATTATAVLDETLEPIFATDSPELQAPAAQHPDGTCTVESCWPVNFIPSLPTATGWEDDNGIAGPTNLAPIEQPALVVTTRTPTIVNIRTSVAPERPGSPIDSDVRPTSTGNKPPQQNTNVHETGSPRPQAVPDVLAPAPVLQQTAGNSLLLEIISRMGTSRPALQSEAFSASPSSPTDDDYGTGDIPAQRQVTSGLGSTSAVETTSSPQITLAVGGIVTIESATLLLTPGLSTTVGAGTNATFIGIATDGMGQTIITMSSSGTAVTATVSDVSATRTLPKTGFEASITDAARPGVITASRTAGVAASSSSKGGAVQGTVELDWWMSTLLGMLGTSIIL